MKIKILESAKQDLSEGFGFYESQKRGLGSYFLESLFSDIESLRCLQAYMVSILVDTTVFFQRGFPSPFIIVRRTVR